MLSCAPTDRPMPLRRTPPPPAAGELAIRLLPQAEHASALQEMIARLSVLLDSAKFLPHVTVQRGITDTAAHLHGPVRDRECVAAYPLRAS